MLEKPFCYMHILNVFLFVSDENSMLDLGKKQSSIDTGNDLFNSSLVIISFIFVVIYYVSKYFCNHLFHCFLLDLLDRFFQIINK